MRHTTDHITFKTYNLRDHGESRPGYAVHFDYDPFLVELLKKIPHADRKYVDGGDDQKWWWIASPHLGIIRQVAALTRYDVRGLE